jgi:hypothetical protein
MCGSAWRMYTLKEVYRPRLLQGKNFRDIPLHPFPFPEPADSGVLISLPLSPVNSQGEGGGDLHTQKMPQKFLPWRSLAQRAPKVGFF